MINKNSKIYVAGHKGLVGNAILRKLKIENDPMSDATPKTTNQSTDLVAQIKALLPQCMLRDRRTIERQLNGKSRGGKAP